MKRVLIFFALILLSGIPEAFSQGNTDKNAPAEDPCIQHEEKTYSWRLSPYLGTRYAVALDTTALNYYNTDVEDSFTTAYNYLANFGSPGESRIFFSRMRTPEFIFMKAYERFNVSPDKATFYNTQIPFTQLAYLTGGSKQNAEDRLKGTFWGNVNKRLGLGASIDYIYTRGFYNWQAVNSLDWQAYVSYIGDKYQLNAYSNAGNFSNQENGGIQNMDYILHPDENQKQLSDPKNIPTNLETAWNRVKQKDIYLTQRYNLGVERTVYMNDQDSVGIEEFVPVTSFIHTFHYSANFRRFRIDPNGVKTKGFYNDTILNTEMTNDSLKFMSVKNTLGIALNEGFHKYAKFGLGAYVTLENRKYTNMQNPDDLAFIDRIRKSNILWVGGELTKQKGSILTYRADALFGLTGDNLGDLYINGELQTKIPMFKDSLIVKANGFFHNIEPSYYMKHYMSNHFAWSNNFSKEKRVHAEGELIIPYTRTKIKAGVENITNYLYFNLDGKPTQAGKNIQVFSAELMQNVRLGILNWDNSIVYQKSSQQDILPLPELSFYSQLYLKFRIARVLHTQLGIDCRMNTKYYSPMYQPATQMFHNQNIAQTGGYPLMNAYANMQLKKVRFYVMMYHVNKGIVGGNDYFLAPFYPMNPRIFKFGLSIDFSN